MLFRRRALSEPSGAERTVGARVRKSRQKEAAGAADAGPMQIEWSEGEVLKWAGVGTEVEKVACEGVAARMDGRRWYERGSGVRMGSGARRTGAERGEPCRVFELLANTSCRRSHQQRGRTELDLSSGQAFDNCHGPTALGAAPKRRLLGGGGCWFGLQWSCTQCCEAKRQ